MSTIELTVQNMTCQTCVQHVTKALNAVPGVTTIEVDLSAGKASVTGTATPDALAAALNEAGYPAKPVHDGETVCCGGCN